MHIGSSSGIVVAVEPRRKISPKGLSPVYFGALYRLGRYFSAVFGRKF